jgi:adenylosuccinate lyase
MTAIWEVENRYRIWLEIETLAAESMARLGTIPVEAARAIRERGNFDAARVDEIELEVKHDVIAFLTSVTEHVGDEARFMHQGMTSSDVLDTSFGVQLMQATDLILAALDALMEAIRRRALEYKYVPTIGRSHGIHAEPTTFGLKLATHYAAFARARVRLVAARAEIAVCAISGPVGTFASVDPRVEADVAAALGMIVEPVSTQIIPRDRHAMYFATLGVVASSIENLATEIRHLQRSEVREAEEYFSPGQKGSSAMPHKRNPILSESLTGLARIVRAAVTPALENVTLWHERDISHSSVERVFAPDATTALHFALTRAVHLVADMVIYPEAMAKNLGLFGGLVYSQRVLLALTQGGMSREDAYRAVQRNALQVWDAPPAGPGAEPVFLTLLKADPQIAAILNPYALEELFDPAWYTRHVDLIFDRVFAVNEAEALD